MLQGVLRHGPAAAQTALIASVFCTKLQELVAETTGSKVRAAPLRTLLAAVQP